MLNGHGCPNQYLFYVKMGTSAQVRKTTFPGLLGVERWIWYDCHEKIDGKLDHGKLFFEAYKNKMIVGHECPIITEGYNGIQKSN